MEEAQVRELIHDFIKESKSITPKAQDALAEYFIYLSEPIVSIQSSPFTDMLLRSKKNKDVDNGRSHTKAS